MYKVIIYGIGAGGGMNLNIICSRLSNRYEVIGYMDSFYKKEFYQYQRVFKIEELSEIDYDYILINAYRQSSDDEIYNMLLQHRICREKIIRYAKYAYYSSEFPIKYTENRLEIFQRLKIRPKFEGFLIGMSYAEIGIDVNQLSGYIFNFAHSAFDLFYRRLLIQSIYELKSGLEHIRYIILELPYYIFNFDLSLCDNGIFQSAINYVSYWKDYHHFTEKEVNRCFTEGFLTFQDMFIKDFLGNSSMVSNSRIMIDKTYADSHMDLKKAIPHTIQKPHEMTMDENRKIFRDIIQMIKEKAPHIKLVILVCPQPSLTRKLYDKYPLQKKIFLEEMESAKLQYQNLIILDEQELFMDHDEYFIDTDGHLNRTGCDAFTKFLDCQFKRLNIYGK